MNQLKKYLGLIWIALGPLIIIFLLQQAIDKIGAAPVGMDRTNTSLQWGIIILIFIPICAGLVIFGKYAWNQEYDKLPDDM
ncbi:hypothetical protein CLV98_103188 [Dyadobacter jejuensis]|uniref:Phospholipase D-like protein n=1 Tax=Dyadobacter jejuensis TaxID=1082580 RepID=A0A316AMU4_9BACT|nr:hypothetical protein [Dyadobacter jejuensis]PWJ58821.1 hypothetical protein CLV98_103188 [Dyadobacter jejuensis]